MVIQWTYSYIETLNSIYTLTLHTTTDSEDTERRFAVK